MIWTCSARSQQVFHGRAKKESGKIVVAKIGAEILISKLSSQQAALEPQTTHRGTSESDLVLLYCPDESTVQGFNLSTEGMAYASEECLQIMFLSLIVSLLTEHFSSHEFVSWKPISRPKTKGS